MEETLCMEARNKAGQFFKDGYNCAESIFLAFKEYIDVDINDQMTKLFTGFGGGLGRAGCMCGALMGAEAVISLLTGRTSTDAEARDACYAYAKAFHDRFKEQYKTTCCRGLNPYDFNSKEHAINCLKITGKTGKMLMEYLLEKELILKTE